MINSKICKEHDITYNYVCPECVKPYLKKTRFSKLAEVREYQKKNAKKVHKIDIRKKYAIIGIMKLKFIDELSYSGILIYNIKENKTLLTKFKSYKPIFTRYFPSILFLNQTKIYLELINGLDLTPDCYILNSSGQIHPYLYGSACDFGLNVKVPVIGYTKKLLFGDLRIIEQFPDIKGVYSQETLIGYAIPKPYSKKFIYISIGNNISLVSALKLFLKMDFNLFSQLNIDLNNFIQSRKRTN